MKSLRYIFLGILIWLVLIFFYALYGSMSMSGSVISLYPQAMLSTVLSPVMVFSYLVTGAPEISVAIRSTLLSPYFIFCVFFGFLSGKRWRIILFSAVLCLMAFVFVVSLLRQRVMERVSIPAFPEYQNITIEERACEAAGGSIQRWRGSSRCSADRKMCTFDLHDWSKCVCTSDAQCPTGQRCQQEMFGEKSGLFCVPR